MTTISDRSQVDGDGERRDEGETERKHDEQVDIAPGDDLVHRKLQIEGPGDDEKLERERQREDLQERVLCPARLAQERRQAQAAPARPCVRNFRSA